MYREGSGGGNVKSCGCPEIKNCVHRVVVDVGGAGGPGLLPDQVAAYTPPPEPIIDASEARKLAVDHDNRKSIRDTARIRDKVARDIIDAVRNGHSSTFLDLNGFHKAAVVAIIEDLKLHGYTIVHNYTKEAGYYSGHVCLSWSGDK